MRKVSTALKELKIHSVIYIVLKPQTQTQPRELARGPTVFKITTHFIKTNECSFSKHNYTLHKKVAIKISESHLILDVKDKNLHKALKKNLYSWFVSECEVCIHSHVGLSADRPVSRHNLSGQGRRQTGKHCEEWEQPFEANGGSCLMRKLSSAHREAFACL